MAEQIELVFGTEASLGLSYTVLEGNSGISKNNGWALPSRTFTQTLDLQKFCKSTSIVSGAVNLGGRLV